jgi:hypothetical protein
MDENIRTAYAHFWSASLQREVFASNFAELTYAGSRGQDLYSITDANRPGSGPAYLGDPPGLGRLNTQYTTIQTRGNDGWSTYNGLTLGWDARRIAGSGLQLTARYTLGFTKDNLSSTFSESPNQYNAGFLDPFDPGLDYGWSDHDVRHRFVMSGIWQVPLAQSASGLERALLGDWSLNWLLTAQSGAPFTLYDCTNGSAACNPRISAFRGYAPGIGGLPGDGQRRIQLGAKLEF